MAYKFEVGKAYRRNDGGFDPVICVKRTDKTIWVKQCYNGADWSMRVRTDKDGNEWAVDHQTQKRYRDEMTFQAKYGREPEGAEQ